MVIGLIGMMAAATAAAGAPPAAPAPPAPPASSAPAKPTDPMDKVECRRMEETGTLLGAKRVCMTKREWADAAREGRRMTEDVQTRGSAAKTPGF